MLSITRGCDRAGRDSSASGAAMRNAGFLVSEKARVLRSGAERSRTVDFLNAIQALYQLSYGPALRGRELSKVAGGGKLKNATSCQRGSGTARAIHFMTALEIVRSPWGPGGSGSARRVR